MSRFFAEEKTISDGWSWTILVLLSLSLMGWGIVIYLFVTDAPRQWDYGKLPYTPGESAYWTHTPPRGVSPPRQMPRLPGSRQLKPEERSIQEMRP